MGFFDWLRRSPQGASSGQTQNETGDPNMEAGMTKIDKPDFEITLPGMWHERPSDEGTEFVNTSGGEQFVVSVLRCQKPLEMSELRPVIERLDLHRRNSLGTLSQGQAKCSPSQFRATDQEIESRFDGVDLQNGVQFSIAIRGCASKVLTFSLYRYSVADVGVPFTIYAGVIFDLLTVKSKSL